MPDLPSSVDETGTPAADDELTAVPLMQLLSGVYAAKTLAAAVEFDVFSKVSGRGVTFEEAQALFDLQPRPAEMLLSGCASLGLLERRGGRFFNSALSEKFLVRGRDEYFGALISMVDRRIYQPWLHITTALRTDRSLTWGDHPGLFEALSADPDGQRLFTEAMHSASRRPAPTRMPEKNLAILRKAYDALPAGDAVIVSELMMDDDKTGPAFAALMSLTMLIETEGRNYTWSEYAGWLEQAGFRDIDRIAIESPGANGLLVGHKPA